MAGTRVYVGRLAYDVREKDIERFFKGCGRIREILLKNGFGFVEFEDYRDADDAVYELNGKELLGERVILEIARGPVRRNRGGGGFGGGGGGGSYGYRRRGNWVDKYGPPSRTDYRIIVENLSTRVSWQDLKDFMRQAGEVTYADAHKRRRNEGTVEFRSFSDMKNAIKELNGYELNGRKIKLYEENPRYRSKSRSRSSSRSRSRSRSRSHRRTKSRSRSARSASHSKSRSKSRSKSASPARDKSKSLSKSRSRSRSQEKSRSRSRSPVERNDRSSDHEEKSDHREDDE